MTVDTENAPHVTLAGKSYPVVPIAFREVSKIVPIAGSAFNKDGLTELSLEALAKVVWLGLKRGNPDLTLDALLDSPISIKEMTDAALVVFSQAGLKKKEASSGEAPGLTKPQTSPN